MYIPQMIYQTRAMRNSTYEKHYFFDLLVYYNWLAASVS